MGSIGWYILGYFVLGAVAWLVGSVVLVIAAAISDIRYDCKHDPSMNRSDTLDALHDTASWVDSTFKDQCQMTENPQANYTMAMMKTLALWPYMLPKGFSTLWKQTVNLRDRRH